MRFAVVTLLLIAAPSAFAESAVILERYSTVSESEWEMTVDLRANQAATLKIARWQPGERDKPNTIAYTGKWSATGTDVVLTFKAGTATFRFQPQLSFAEFERNGAAPGLVGTSASFQQSMIVKRSLWLESELKKLKP